MRPALRSRSTRVVLAGLGILLAPGLGGAEQAEYVITLDHVAVQGLIGIFDTPEVAHIDPPAEGKTMKGGESPSASPRRPSAAALESPAYLRVRGVSSPSAFAPGEAANPNFVQHGFLVEAFWVVKAGTADAFFKRAHFHPPDLSSGFEGQHLGNSDELHGIYIRSLDGQPFGVKTLRYRVTRNRQIPTKPFSITGFNNFDVNVLLARRYDPKRSIREQFQTFPVGLAMGNDPTLPWWTLQVTGFELVDHVYIASSASVDFDDIVLTRFQPPTPSLDSGEQPVPDEAHPRSGR